MSIAGFILKHKRLLLLFTSAGGLMAALTPMIIPKVYESSALIFISQDRSEMSFDPRFKSMEERMDIAVRRRSLEALSVSHDLLLRVYERMRPRFASEAADPNDVREWIEVSTSGEILRATVITRDPNLSSDLANCWAEIFCNIANTSLRADEDGLKATQESARQALGIWRKAHEALTAFTLTEDNSTSLELLYKSMRLRLDELYIISSRLERGIRDAESLLAQQGSRDAATITTDFSLAVAALLVRLGALESSVPGPIQVQVGQGVTANGGSSGPNPTTQTLDAALSQYRKGMLKVKGMLEEPGFHAEMRKLQSEIEKLQGRRRELTGEREVAWETYLTVTRKAQEIRLASSSGERVAVRMASQAVPNQKPSRPRLASYIWKGLVLGFAVGLASAWFLETTRKGKASVPSAQGEADPAISVKS
jgi:capsular polysaccharide biosynthesis protein